MHPNIFSNLFKSYCCSFYCSFLWKYSSNGCCTQWNKSSRNIFYFPHNAHRWLLGPLLNQPHISHKFYIRHTVLSFCIVCYNGIISLSINALGMHHMILTHLLVLNCNFLDLNLVTIYMI